MTDGTRRVIIGLGNDFRGDDAAGLVVAEKLRGRVPPTVSVVASDGDPAKLMDAWEGAESVVIVDAVVSGRAPGTVHVWHEQPPPAALPARSSSHQLSLGEALAVADALARPPRGLVVIGIEIAAVVAGADMSPEVSAGVDRAVDIAASVCCHPAATAGGSALHA